MAELMNRDDFRSALEQAIQGRSANKSPFSIAWASGKLSRAHLARWAENHYHYVGPFADYLAYIYGRTPDTMTEAKDFLLDAYQKDQAVVVMRGSERFTLPQDMARAAAVTWM